MEKLFRTHMCGEGSFPSDILRKIWISSLLLSLSFCSSEAVAIGDIADGGNNVLYLLGSLSAMVAELGRYTL